MALTVLSHTHPTWRCLLVLQIQLHNCTGALGTLVAICEGKQRRCSSHFIDA